MLMHNSGRYVRLCVRLTIPNLFKVYMYLFLRFFCFKFSKVLKQIMYLWIKWIMERCYLHLWWYFCYLMHFRGGVGGRLGQNFSFDQKNFLEVPLKRKWWPMSFSVQFSSIINPLSHCQNHHHYQPHGHHDQQHIGYQHHHLSEDFDQHLDLLDKAFGHVGEALPDSRHSTNMC